MYFAFLDLERVDRDAMWNVLRLYGIGGRLLRGVTITMSYNERGASKTC